MELHEYVNRYMEWIKIAVARLYLACDLPSQRSLNLLHNEYLLAVQEYEFYVSEHKHTPDDSDLMDHFEEWGIHRSELFQENERLISEADFVHYYLAYVNSGKELKVTDFTKEDYRFILQRERYLVHKMFQQNCSDIYSYQELNIRQLKIKVLKKRFETDYAGFYAGMKVK